MKSYLISVCGAAMVCSIISGFSTGKGSIGALIKLLCGLFMLYTLFAPVLTLKLQTYTDHWNQLTLEAEYNANIGTTYAQKEMNAIISEQTITYISEKTSSLGLDMDIDVSINNGIPDAVYISGAISPYAKKQLSNWLTNQLGIEAEAQYWTE
jgi:hypothetical protein